MAKAGRPPALDDFKKKRFCGLIALGYDPRQAAAAVGCAYLTARREANRDRDFAEQWRNAETIFVARPLDTLQKAAGENWRAACWMMERVYPKRYLKSPPRQITLETSVMMGKELADEVFAVLPPGKVRRRAMGRLRRLFRLWGDDWRRNGKLKDRKRTGSPSFKADGPAGNVDPPAAESQAGKPDLLTTGSQAGKPDPQVSAGGETGERKSTSIDVNATGIDVNAT